MPPENPPVAADLNELLHGTAPGPVGKSYCFDPPVEATGYPVGGPQVCEAQVLQFDRGLYIGLKKPGHAFKGVPINDPQNSDPASVEYFFHVDFTGGSACFPDED